MPESEPRVEWKAQAKGAARAYGLPSEDVESEVKRQLAQKLAEGIVKKLISPDGVLLW